VSNVCITSNFLTGVSDTNPDIAYATFSGYVAGEHADTSPHISYGLRDRRPIRLRAGVLKIETPPKTVARSSTSRTSHAFGLDEIDRKRRNALKVSDFPLFA
jgi:hypothetical protein